MKRIGKSRTIAPAILSRRQRSMLQGSQRQDVYGRNTTEPKSLAARYRLERDRILRRSLMEQLSRERRMKKELEVARQNIEIAKKLTLHMKAKQLLMRIEEEKLVWMMRTEEEKLVWKAKYEAERDKKAQFSPAFSLDEIEEAQRMVEELQMLSTQP